MPPAKSRLREMIGNREALSAVLLTVFKGVLAALTTLLLAMTPLLLSSKPLGIALFAAMEQSAPASFLGLVCAALAGPDRLPSLLSALTLFALRTGICLRYYARDQNGSGPSGWRALYREPVPVRMVIALFGGFLSGIVAMISAGGTVKSVGTLLLSMLIAPAAAWFYAGLGTKSRSRTAQKGAIYILLLSVVYALRDFQLFGFSIACIAAFFSTMWASKGGGVLRGGVMGVLTGFAFDVLYAPAFALAGIIAGLFWEMHGMLALSAGTVFAAGMTILINGFTALRTVCPDLIVAGALFAPVLQMNLLPGFSAGTLDPPAKKGNIGEAIIEKKVSQRNMLRMEALSSALSGLSEVCYTLSERLRKPGIYRIRQLADDVFDGRCAQCPMQALCAREDCGGCAEAKASAVHALQQNGVCLLDDLPEEFTARCRSAGKILSELNGFYASMLSENVRTDKTEVFAMDYESMSKMLQEALDTENSAYHKDESASKKLREAAEYLHFPAKSIAVFGDRRKTILASEINLSRMSLSGEEIRDAFTRICGCPMTAPQFALDYDFVTMAMTSCRQLQFDAAFATSKKAEETVNGDNMVSFENKEDCYYCLLSDGMGSGYEAALTSKMCCIFLEKMLSAGCSVALSLEMLNNFMRGRNLECFSTIDLLQIDLIEKRAVFVKSGAAPSYVYRDGSLFKITSNSMPVGITREINAEEIRFDLKEGDIVIMTSDGVAQSFDDTAWLSELVCMDWEDHLQHMADKILHSAEQRSRRGDDISVGLIRLDAVPSVGAARAS